MALYKTKETALKYLREGRCFKNKAFDMFREDIDVLRTAIALDTTSLIPIKFQGDEELAEILLTTRTFNRPNDTYQILSVGRSLLADKNFISRILGMNRSPVSCTNIYLLCSDEVKHDKEICIQMIKSWISAILFIPDAMKKDYDILVVFANQLRLAFFAMRGDRSAILQSLNLPDLDGEELLQYLQADKLKNSLESKLNSKDETKRTVKI